METENFEKLVSWREYGQTITGTQEEMDLAFSSLDTLFKLLDQMVIDVDAVSYKRLKAALKRRIIPPNNPYCAGRPPIYTEADEKHVMDLLKQGKTVRQINKETGISLGKISNIKHRVH